MMTTSSIHYATWLVFFSFLLFPFSRSVELPILIMTVAGGVIAYRYGRTFFQEPAVRLFSFLFACIWIPILISYPDSYDLKKSGSTALTFIRFYLSGLFIIWVMRNQKQASVLVKLLAGLTAFWVVDALFQAATGRNFFGYEQIPARLNGIFGEDGLKLGGALPVLAPFLILALRQRIGLMLLATVMTGAVVILAGSSGGWVSFGLVCIWLILSETQRRRVPFWKAGMVTALIGLVGTFAVFENPGAKQRLDQTLLLFSGDKAKIDLALSLRWTLWEDAFALINAHPIKGVGVRAFRYAYPEFVPPESPFLFINKKSGETTGPTYAHQIIVEVTSETGLIGLAGLGLFYFLLIRSWRGASDEQKIRSLPFAMGTLAWIFPLNTHPAFYSSQWSVLIWMMIALLCGSLHKMKDNAPPHAGST
jgi:O-antigen ligase